MTKAKARRCKDCPPDKNRPAPNPGPRCATHWREERKRKSAQAHARRLEKTYGLTGEEYAQLLEHQGGTCAICQVATGKRKNLAVDHDHQTGRIRGLLCGRCNHRLLGAAMESVEVLERALQYLQEPPAAEAGLDRTVPSALDPREE